MSKPPECRNSNFTNPTILDFTTGEKDIPKIRAIPDNPTEAHCHKFIYPYKNNNGFNVSYLPCTTDSVLEGFMEELPTKNE